MSAPWKVLYLQTLRVLLKNKHIIGYYRGARIVRELIYQ